MKKWRVAAVHKERVEEAILVVIDPRHARAHRFQIKLLVRGGTLVMKANPRLSGNVKEPNSERIRVIAFLGDACG
jgi:hypothetical protein